VLTVLLQTLADRVGLSLTRTNPRIHLPCEKPGARQSGKNSRDHLAGRCRSGTNVAVRRVPQMQPDSRVRWLGIRPRATAERSIDDRLRKPQRMTLHVPRPEAVE
jgi:hypothetical protein